MTRRPRRLLFDARVLGTDGIGRVTGELLPGVVARAAAHGLELAVLTRVRLPGIPVQRQAVDRSMHYSTEELAAPAKAAARFKSEVFLSLDVKIGFVPAHVTVVAVVHDLMRVMRPELCYSDAGIVERWGYRGLDRLMAAVQALGRSLDFQQDADGPAHVAYCALAARWMLRRADLLLAPSRATITQVMATRQPLRRPPHILPWGLDHLTRVSHPARPRDGTPRYLLYVGQDRPHKNVTALLDAFDALRGLKPELELWLVGRDFEANGAGRGGVGDRVRLLGQLDDRSLAETLARAAVLVQPSSEEGFGFGPFEALLAGTPVLLGPAPVFTEHFAALDARDVGWARERLEEEIAREARRLLRFDTPAERAARAARARSTFGARTWASQTDEVFELIASTGRAP